jgi:non-ribosomal peptide synthetase component F
MGARRPWETRYPPGEPPGAANETATLPSLFDAIAEKWADRRALEHRDLRTSYAQLRAGVDQFASSLISAPSLACAGASFAGMPALKEMRHPEFQ